MRHYGKHISSIAVCFKGHPKNAPSNVTTLESIVTCPECKAEIERLNKRVELRVPEHLYSQLRQYCQNEGFKFESDPCVHIFWFDLPEERKKLMERVEVILKSGSDE